jgi:hypothetical protein
MDERELLEKYEPVLRFSKSERFFPMAVEPYLEKCTIFPSGPKGVVELLSNLNEPIVTLLGKLESGEYFLRFVNDPLIDSDIWVWWGALSAVAIGRLRPSVCVSSWLPWLRFFSLRLGLLRFGFF